MARKTYKYRLYPTSAQVKILNFTIDNCRFLYNSSREERISYYKKFGKYRSGFDQMKELPEIKKLLPEFKDTHSQVLQNVLDRSDKTFKDFFRRLKNGEKAGFPRFQKSDRYHSFTYTQSGFAFKKDRLFLSKIGHIKIVQHREIIGEIKTCTITKSSTGEWYACISVEFDPVPLPKTNKIIGVDLGIKTYIYTSDKEKIENPKLIKKHGKKLIKDQRRYSKDKTPEKRKILAKSHQKIRNCRDDYQHKVSSKLVKENDIIIIEDLDIRKMLQNNKEEYKNSLNQYIQDASWSNFTEKLTYKAEYADKKVIKVNPAYTSKSCSHCGHINSDLKLEDRIYRCSCGIKIDRDYNAALNIKKRGISQYRDLPEIRDIISSIGNGKKPSAFS